MEGLSDKISLTITTEHQIEGESGDVMPEQNIYSAVLMEDGGLVFLEDGYHYAKLEDTVNTQSEFSTTASSSILNDNYWNF